MNVTVSIPDDIAQRLGSGAELARRALEGFALEEYRAGRLTRPDLRRLLGLATRPELDALLNKHGIVEGLTIPEFDRQLQDLDRIGL